MNITARIKKSLDIFFAGKRRSVAPFVLINIFLVLLQVLYIFSRYKYINSEIPFWFAKNWGDFQLAPKFYIYYLPATAFVLTVVAGLTRYLNRLYLRYFDEIVSYFITVVNIFIFYCVYYIIQSASLPFPPFISAKFLALFPPFLGAFVAVYAVLPYFIDFANRKRLVTDPGVHRHPAMLLREPSARGGGFVYAVTFLLISVLFLGLGRQFHGIYLSVLMLAVLGITDDFQNTHPTSEFRVLENPFLRLLLLFLCVLPIILSGLVVNTVSIPFDGLVDLGNLTIIVGSVSIPVVSAILTTIWVVWMMNALSWSNGIDGQFAGVIGISSIFVAILALRFENLEPVHRNVAVMAAISAGAAFGFTKYTWYPSKIMWGFGAMAAGLVIAALSISVQTKVLVSVLFILIPFLDALVTFFRRIFQGKNPLSGDRGHLHHLLLDRGWSIQKIARFYWFAAILFGLIGLLSPERYIVKLSLTVIGGVGFFIALLNLKSLGRRKQKQESE
ncbi:MAG: Undecaprenyl-phosphate alpha-N-acetylglucosaminyltransferase [candidate division WWE3 bacterium GW2011_GWF2_41_45]|uniref:Undecaprenyl-phosphate alpha-N-acetylglucosaminyl 1-phosphate transferase n=3 Tax=Katanobacteria TaxID=422282 RepID=A0A1F4W079_UNCKA|nr:MAG: Undecaprenyl-phosphate alpha-N-acetylglucosaminyltransferase [candidate division WWE3 bacterium GW2011_GWC2_41_23]KKS09557.1 MAG: Undecaprenyl-phosphate alpha-N-acetylglucosaminyltransferase [candidate division WWE3 bacterium GW2011_GWF2_41_45]KKS12125.1 MAG: Undecaprenyl-phosphate alpha-N-acetylglucosaminyltransferase [candidate division WWE3 bacterium GW2011_GWF1_41_53]KKS28076.1 MAG: UDP-phosphate alpha-N-acetylglucosaminyltransferase [candidate division WWE3 bacterium GW2011_GWC1_42_